MSKKIVGYNPEKILDMSINQAVDKLSSSIADGLTDEEFRSRLEQFGENVVEEKMRNPVLEFFSHFWGPIPWMIEIAAVLAGSVQRWEEVGVIVLLLLVNGIVGYWHENKARSAIEALKKQMAYRARVIRDSRQRMIPAKLLVPGDIIVLRMGDIVPAEAKILEGGNIGTDESSLTGESFPVEKNGSDNVFSGTTVKHGEARALVVATGKNTRFARTVELVSAAKEVSHFQRAVLRIGYVLMGAAILLVLSIIIASIIRKDSFTEVLIFILGLVLAGIPVALPTVLSVTMSIGAGHLAQWKAIVSRLPAMEEMAGLKILCADKTGTLTKNELQLQEPVLFEANDAHELILTAALTVRRGETEDPIDNAVMSGLKEPDELSNYTLKKLRPFDSVRKMADADIEYQGTMFTVAKGAPQAILNLTGPDTETVRNINTKVNELGTKGLRTLGVAKKEPGSKWRYLGLLSLQDPPREDSAEVIKDARAHGIDIRMVTGDHLAIAKQMAKQLGLRDNIKLAGEIFHEAEYEDEETIKAVTEADGFAEITPEYKYKIIKAFQAEDIIVGMTGDGVNDAPALKQADVGIAVVGASDAARSSAALVLTAKGLGVITRAVEEARRIFVRMINYATYRITETIRLLLFVTISVLVFNFYPVTAIMIILLAILNDLPIIAIAWDNVRTPSHPVRWDMPKVLTMAGVLGTVGLISSFLFYYYLRRYSTYTHNVIQTMLFLKLLVAGHMTLYLTRTGASFWEKPYPSLSLFITLEITQIIGTLVSVYGVIITPIGWINAAIVWAYAFVWFLILNFVKIITSRIIH